MPGSSPGMTSVYCVHTNLYFKQYRLQTQLRDLAACFARVLPGTSCPFRRRAQGMPGAQCARSLAGQKKQAMPVTVTTVTPENPAFPAQWFYGFLRALPGDRAFLPPSSADKFRRLDTSVGVSGPHVFA